MNSILLFIGGPEVFVILLIVVMLFGADKIPEIARGLGKGIRQVKDATNDIKEEINKSAQQQGIDTQVLDNVTKDVNQIKEEMDTFTRPVKRNK